MSRTNKGPLKAASSSLKRISIFQNKILSFYKVHKRDLPWRKTKDPYAILLSEIMLQQTQVSRGIFYYGKWLRRWPTIHQLARARRHDILREWMGLGYNNRAKHLHESARIISEKFAGDVLGAMGHYDELPGIGPYTACAVRIFSNNENIAAVDTNIRRILIHEFSLNEKTKDSELLKIAKKCLPKGKSREWHNALMDYGATFFTARKSGIRPKSRQSRFEGSDRQLRAKVLRQILKGKDGIGAVELRKAFPSDRQRLGKVLDTLAKDGLIEKVRGKHFLIG